MKKQQASEAEIKKLYDPQMFYEHGDNPALKKFMDMMVENNRDGRLTDHRTYFVEKYTKLFHARNVEDIMQRDLKCITFPRTAAVFMLSTWGTLVLGKWGRQMLPIGQHGITKFSQTQFFHLYGHLGVAAVLASQVAGIFYIIQIGMVLWYKTAKFTAKKFYYHCLLGERNWLYEQERQNAGYGEYFFNDTPFSCEEAFPDLARGEMSKKKVEKGSENL